MWASAYSSGAGTWVWPPLSSSCGSPLGSARVAGGIAIHRLSATAVAAATEIHQYRRIMAGSSEIPVDADEHLIAPVAKRVVLVELPEVHAVADEERDVLPRVIADLRGEDASVELVVLQPARPELIETAREKDGLVSEIVQLDGQPGCRAIEITAELAGQAVDLVTDDRAVEIERVPAHVGGEAIAQSIEASVTRLLALHGIRSPNDAEAPVEQARDVERQPFTV